MGFPKGVEHPLCDILISAGVKTLAAKWLRLLPNGFIFRKAKPGPVLRSRVFAGRLFVQPVDIPGLVQLLDETAVDEIFRIGRFHR